MTNTNDNIVERSGDELETPNLLCWLFREIDDCKGLEGMDLYRDRLRAITDLIETLRAEDEVSYALIKHHEADITAMVKQIALQETKINRLESRGIEDMQARIAELEAEKENILANTDASGKRVVKIASERQHRIAELEGWIKIAGGIKCPNCSDEGFNPAEDGYGGWMQEQCEFCYTCPDSMFNHRAALEDKP